MAEFTTERIATGAKFEDLSENGRFLSYTVKTGTTHSLYVNNLTTGANTLVASVEIPSGKTYAITGGELSADGRYIFYSTGNALVGGGGNLLIKDLQSSNPATEVPYVLGSGSRGFVPRDISADGQRIVFQYEVLATISGSPSFDGYVVLNVATGAEVRRTEERSDHSESLTPDGRYLLVDRSGKVDLVDLQTNSVLTESNAFGAPGVSDNGRFFAYSYLPPGSFFNVRLHDQLNPSSDIVISTAADGTPANAEATLAAFSGDGRHVAFGSKATNLVPGDTDGDLDLFVKDLNTGAIRLVGPFSGVKGSVSLSFDGSVVLYGDPSGDIFRTTVLPPTLNITSISGDNLVSAAEEAAPVTVAGTSNAIGQALRVTSPSGEVAFTTVAADGTWNTTVQSSGVNDGIRTFSAVVINDFGVLGNASRTAVFDSAPPTLIVNSVAGDNFVNASERASFQATGTSDTIGASVSIKINGVVVGSATVGATGAWSQTLDFTGRPDGQYDFSATIADAAGNANTRSIFFDVDGTPPTIAIRSVAGDNVVSASEIFDPVRITGTSNAIGRTVTVTFGNQERGKAVVQTNGTWQTDVQFTGVPGSVVVFANVSDAAGNIGGDVETVFVDSTIVRASTRADGSQSTNSALQSGVSADGRFVVFVGNQTGLVPGEPADYSNIYLKDVQTGDIRIVSRLPGVAPDGDAYNPVISADGRFVAFVSHSSTLVAGDTNDAADVFVLDVVTSAYERVNTTDLGEQAAASYTFVANKFLPAISADGRYVAFASNSITLDPGNATGLSHVFVKDRQTGDLQRVSETPLDARFHPYAGSFAPAISADGRFVAFASHISIGATGNDRGTDIYVRDMETGVLTLVSTASNIYSPLRAPGFSADGRYLVFESTATTIPGYSSLGGQGFIRDLQTGETRLFTYSGGPIFFMSAEVAPIVSDDGRYVAFLASKLDGSDRGAYVRDLLTGSITRVAPDLVDNDSTAAGIFSFTPDGRYIAFASFASNLVSGDTNGENDIFLRRLIPQTLTLDPVAGDDRVTGAEASAALSIGGSSSVIGGVVTIRVDQTVVGTTTVGAGGAWSSTINTIALSPGAHSMTATAVDWAGFTSSDGAILTIEAGAPPAISTYNGGLPASRALAGGFAGAGSTVQLFDGGLSLGSAVTNASGLWQVSFDALGVGVHNLAAMATPPGGSASALSASFKVIVTSAGQSILSGPGADTLIGGAGLDTADYSAKAASVVVFLNGAIAAAVTVGGAAEDTVRDIENIIGGSGNDTLVGDGKANVFTGGGGTDFLFSNGFNPDGTMKTGAGSDALSGGDGDDGLFGGDGADALNGDDGNDGMVGGGGGDKLNGGAGGDFLFGGAFSPSGAFLANSGDDTLNGGDGNDGLYGQDGNDTINGDVGNDYVEGGAGNDTINGGAGSDFLLGQDGNDTIGGGAGFDYEYGGLGADTFIFRKGDSADWVLDFNAAHGDKLRLLDFGYANFAAVPLVDLSTAGNLAVQLSVTSGGVTDQLTVFGVTLTQLNAGNVLIT